MINQCLPRTIFITSFHGLVSRVLLSGVLDYLQQQNNYRIILLVPDFKKAYFQEVFGRRPGIIIETVSREQLPWSALIFHKLSFVFLHTRTMKLIRRSFRGYRHFYQIVLAQLMASGLGRWRVVRELFRAINYYLSGPPMFTGFFETYKPDLVFSTDVKELLDSQLLIEAKKRKVFTIGMVRSWDYLTGKGMVRIKPDKLVVHNRVIQAEAERYADMKPENIFVSGIPHYDPYLNERRSNREEFFKAIGADPTRRLIFYAPWGDKFADTDWEFLEMLGRAISEGSLPNDLQILVRMPPSDNVNWRPFPLTYPILFNYPGVEFGRHRKANEMSYQDLLHLADSLYYSEVVVTPPSTIAIDAAVFDKPVVLMAFDGFKPKGYYEGVGHYYDFDHIKNLTATGAQKLAKTEHELIQMINQYLLDPSLDREGRQRLVREQCGSLDGRSSRRLANFILLR